MTKIKLTKLTADAGPRDLEGGVVFDAKAPLHITVIDSDITRADRKEPDTCAMALAVRRCVHAHEVRVHMTRVYVRKKANGPWTRYLTSAPLRTELVSFDRGGGFQAGTYMLHRVYKSQRVGVRAHRYADNKRVHRDRKHENLGLRRPLRVLKNVRGHSPL